MAYINNELDFVFVDAKYALMHLRSLAVNKDNHEKVNALFGLRKKELTESLRSSLIAGARTDQYSPNGVLVRALGWPYTFVGQDTILVDIAAVLNALEGL
jgi:hypothetical protein